MAYILSFSSHLHLSVNKFNSFISEDGDQKSKKKKIEAIKWLKVRKRETEAPRHTWWIQRLSQLLSWIGVLPNEWGLMQTQCFLETVFKHWQKMAICSSDVKARQREKE